MGITPPLKYHGGKTYLAKRIVSLFPRHLHYVEPYFGGGAVLLERDPNDKSLWVADDSQRGGVSEVANDINGELMAFWSVLRSPELFPAFQRMCQATELGRGVFHSAFAHSGSLASDVEKAWGFFVRARQSRAGTFKGFTSLTRSRTRRGINGNASEWLGCIDGLPAVHARLRPVVIECMDALKLIAREDTPDTLFYLDPPYLHETRTTTDAYAHEMTEADHQRLLQLLWDLKGKFLLSGYRSKLYDECAAGYGWRCETFDMANHAAGGGKKRRIQECVWRNYDLGAT